MPPLNLDGHVVEDYQSIAQTFNTYFTTVTDKMNVNSLVNINVSSNDTHPLSYLHQGYGKQFPSMKLAPVTTKEIRQIVKSLKWKNSHDYIYMQ